ncbi:MAG: FAD synthetase family protein [Treponema sp.]|nr:FAD synthetase family protein [Treponema sp.]
MTVFTWTNIAKIFSGAECLPPLFANGSAITVGNFDGVHIGHAVLFDMVRAASSVRSLVPGAVTFSQSFGAFKADSAYGGDITTLNQRLELFEKNGMSFAVVIDFSAEFGKIDGSDFLSMLRTCCCMNYIAEGVDFRCGHRGAYGSSNIAQFAQENGIVAEFAAPVLCNGERVSSSLIRALIQRGDFFAAGNMLGRDYALDCAHVPWAQCGSMLSCSREHIVQVLPPEGEYAVALVTPETRMRARLYVEPHHLRLEVSSEKTRRVRTIAFITN